MRPSSTMLVKSTGYMYVHHHNFGNGTQNEIILGAPSSIIQQTHAMANMGRKCMQAGFIRAKGTRHSEHIVFRAILQSMK